MSIEKMGPKKRGRPQVDSEAIKIRAQRTMLDNIDAYANQAEISRSEAVRQLVEYALAHRKG